MAERSFFISTDQSLLDVALIWDYLANHSYWARGRSRDTVEKSIENSLCFGVYTLQNEQVGFARIITDYSVFAWIMDVFIVEEYRGKGLSKKLMEEVMKHPSLQGLQRWGLNTKDAHGLYEQYGFERISRPDWMMEKTKKPA
ncbi:GNAT family N-acetyltransferase [Nafulsella turpanensis]|uniref:GNAT family N-acetyltransferase n=1 Tax=Nafulsella turpanensis TaxID=1265690 RepID=UPI00034C8808|nr:GNAT family N-acetyltransferase [Nafulsella turpanensis]